MCCPHFKLFFYILWLSDDDHLCTMMQTKTKYTQHFHHSLCTCCVDCKTTYCQQTKKKKRTRKNRNVKSAKRKKNNRLIYETKCLWTLKWRFVAFLFFTLIANQIWMNMNKNAAWTYSHLRTHQNCRHLGLWLFCLFWIA